MIKFVIYDNSGDVYIAPEHVVGVQKANPSGSVITLTRGVVHVKQSVDQVMQAIGAALSE